MTSDEPVLALLERALHQTEAVIATIRSAPAAGDLTWPLALRCRFPEESPAYDRLAGWFGRDPSWDARP